MLAASLATAKQKQAGSAQQCASGQRASVLTVRWLVYCMMVMIEGRGSAVVQRVGSWTHLQHGEVAQGEVPEPGDVEEGDLVSALPEVAPRQLHRRPQIPYLGEHQQQQILGKIVCLSCPRFASPMPSRFLSPAKFLSPLLSSHGPLWHLLEGMSSHISRVLLVTM